MQLDEVEEALLFDLKDFRYFLFSALLGTNYFTEEILFDFLADPFG